jgi:hypothetical protein
VNAGEFDIAFFEVQALELAAGLANITLRGLNIREGLKTTAASAANQQRDTARVTPSTGGLPGMR